MKKEKSIVKEMYELKGYINELSLLSEEGLAKGDAIKLLIGYKKRYNELFQKQTELAKKRKKISDKKNYSY